MNYEYIEHHGILGQKWGVRRYQNLDGSLTPAGRKRISKEYQSLDGTLKTNNTRQNQSLDGALKTNNTRQNQSLDGALKTNNTRQNQSLDGTLKTNNTRQNQSLDGALKTNNTRQNQSLDGALKTNNNFSEISNKTIKTNSDGSQTVPIGFKFNRVGKSQMDINKSGGLYVSYGKEDAARYVKYLGPTPIAKLLGTAGEVVQHITVKEPLHVPSDNQTASEVARLLLQNSKMLDDFNESIYSLVATEDSDAKITKGDLEQAVSNPESKQAQKISFGVSSYLGDENYASESKVVYEHFRAKGFDAIPDVHDRLSGTSKSAMIVINPNKVEVTSSTYITKDVMKSAKRYVKSIEKLKVSDILK